MKKEYIQWYQVLDKEGNVIGDTATRPANIKLALAQAKEDYGERPITVRIWQGVAHPVDYAVKNRSGNLIGTAIGGSPQTAMRLAIEQFGKAAWSVELL